VCKVSTELANAIARGVMTLQFLHTQAAHRKAEGLKIRKRIFRPSALKNFDCGKRMRFSAIKV
jgi:hypothetical protein